MVSTPHSHFPGISWPAIGDMPTAQAMALQFQLQQSQWFSPEDIRALQFEQLGQLVSHAYRHSPFYREAYQSAGVRPKRCFDQTSWSKLPIIKRQQIQTAGKSLNCRQLPDGHAAAGSVTTSGSTGMSVTVAQTAVSQLFWRAFTLRDHLWHRRDLTGRLASIRNVSNGKGEPPNGTVFKAWGASTSAVYRSGPSHVLNIHANVDQQLDWLSKLSANYLLTYPSNLLAMVERAHERGMSPPPLSQIITMGEIVTPQLRDVVREYWQLPIKDIYSCQETGYLALQCPEHEHYHVQSENVLLEVLDENDQPCLPGEVGRVVVSSLNNYATPLIRYELGDYAEVGAPCSCGRGQPVLKRVMGRVRNMLVLPDGSKRWPYVGSGLYRNVADIRQFQLIQTAREQIEVHLACRPLSSEQRLRLTEVIQEALLYPFRLSFHYHNEIKRTTGGKFEDFICRIDTP